MIALLQSAPTGEGVFIPAWMIGLFGASFMILLLIIGFFIKNMIATFKGLVVELKTALGEAVKAFQAFKDEAPKEFVTHPFFDLARQELKDDITNGHRRIGEAVAHFQKTLDDHRRECPGRVAHNAAVGRD